MRITALKTTLLLGITWILAACGPMPTREIHRVAGTNPDWLTNNAYQWARIKTNAARVRLQTLYTGQVKVPTAGMLNTDNAKTEMLTHSSLWVDVYAHWIRHPTKGDFLIDTGLDHRFQDTARGSLKGLIAPWIVEDSRQEPGQDIASQVRAHNIKLKGVFLSHTHGDHTSGLPALPANTPIYLGPGEPLHQYPAIMYNDHLDQVKRLYELDFSQAKTLSPLGKVLDLFGDGSLWAIHTPGHTAGNLSFLVHTTHGWQLLTGDASHTEWGFKQQVIPGWAEDSDAAEQSLQGLHEFATANPEIRVIFGHEGGR